MRSLYTDINQHPAMRLPQNVEMLKFSIVEITQMLASEAPYYLMQAFGITRQQATILHFLSASEETARERIRCVINKGVTLDTHSRDKRLKTFDVQLCRLRRQLKNFGVSIGGFQQETLLIESGSESIGSALHGFRENSEEVCRILETKSLKISEEALPNDKRKLQDILSGLLEFIRGKPAEAPIAGLGLRPSYGIVLGVFAASLQQGNDFVFTHRFEKALYPPWIDSDVETKRVVFVNLVRLHKELGCPVIRNHGFHMTPIAEPIRHVFQPNRPCHSSAFATA